MFWSHHMSVNGYVNAVLLLDNCSAQTDVNPDQLPDRLTVVYLPPNMTSNHKPADMGMIASLKVGHKTTLLRNLLILFDTEGGYQNAADQRAQDPCGRKGLMYGGKATVLYAMIIFNDLYSEDKKYAEENVILRCWRKAGILPVSWNADIENAAGSASLAAKDNTVSTEDCDLMCSLMNSLTTKDATVYVNTEAYVLQDSFVEDSINDLLDFRAMVEAWIEIEDDEHIIEA